MEFDMMSVLTLIVVLAGAVLAGIAAYRSGKVPATVETVSEMVVDAVSDIEVAAGAAQEYVCAAEQLWKTCKLTKDSRFSWVLWRLKEAFPAIPEETLKANIEAAVMWLKAVTGEMPKTGR